MTELNPICKVPRQNYVTFDEELGRSLNYSEEEELICEQIPIQCVIFLAMFFGAILVLVVVFFFCGCFIN